MYKVKLQQFEGPMDLLVYLIEHARMSIYDIRISEITSQYLEYINEMKKQDIAVAQEFMVLAAELIELKSKMLLPGAENEEEAEEDDPRKALVARILEYKQYKEMADFFKDQEEITSHIHTKPQEDLSVYEGEADEFVKSDMEQFVSAFRNFLFKKQKMEEMKKHYERIERQRMSVENKIAQIKDLFRSRKTKKLNFSEIVADDGSRFNVVVTFMSLLEMLKDKRVTADQKKRFGDIQISLMEESSDR